jgi:hypothetical protein
MLLFPLHQNKNNVGNNIISDPSFLVETHVSAKKLSMAGYDK